MSDLESHGHDRLEAALRQLTPAPPSFAKDRVVFLSGQAAGQRARWRLALLSALLGVGTGMAGTYLGLRTTNPAEAVPPVVVIQVPVPVPEKEAPEPLKKQQHEPSAPATTVPSDFPGQDSLSLFARPVEGYLQLRFQVLRWGVEALPAAAPVADFGPAPPPTSLLKMQSDWVGKASEF